jgi:hypothetical protein
VYTAGASHITALAVEAQFQCLVKRGGVLQAVALPVGARLLGTGIIGSHSGNRADGGADAALGALFKVVLAEVADLHSFSHNIPLKNHQSNRYVSNSKSLLEVYSKARMVMGAVILSP